MNRIFNWCIIGSITSPIWGTIYINSVLGTITNRYVRDESGSVYRTNKNGNYEQVSIDTSYEKLLSTAVCVAPWAFLVGGFPFAPIPFIATFYVPMHLIAKGIDRRT
jgi:hypothetical protein